MLTEPVTQSGGSWCPSDGRLVWPRDRWWLTDAEIEEFCEIGRLLDAGVDIDPTMERFHNLVTGRALRMTHEVFRRLPEAGLFAADQGVAGAEPSPVSEIADALGIEKHEDVPAENAPDTVGLTDDRVERVLRVADDWGSGATLRDFVARMLRLGLQVRGYTWTLTISPPATKALALISRMLNQQQRGFVTTWVAPWHSPNTSLP